VRLATGGLAKAGAATGRAELRAVGERPSGLLVGGRASAAPAALRRCACELRCLQPSIAAIAARARLPTPAPAPGMPATRPRAPRGGLAPIQRVRVQAKPGDVHVGRPCAVAWLGDLDEVLQTCTPRVCARRGRGPEARARPHRARAMRGRARRKRAHAARVARLRKRARPPRAPARAPPPRGRGARASARLRDVLEDLDRCVAEARIHDVRRVREPRDDALAGAACGLAGFTLNIHATYGYVFLFHGARPSLQQGMKQV
jgi:hypothetical protein